MSEPLGHYLQLAKNGGKSYVKDTNNFLEKLKIPGKCHLILYLSQWMWLVFIPASCMTWSESISLKITSKKG